MPGPGNGGRAPDHATISPGPAARSRHPAGTPMQAIVWILRLLVVLVLVWFAVRNTDPVTINALPDQSWQAPLVFVMLVAFVTGMVIGLLAWIPTVVRQRRELARLRRNAALKAAMPPPPVTTPGAPSPPERTGTDVHGV